MQRHSSFGGDEAVLGLGLPLLASLGFERTGGSKPHSLASASETSGMASRRRPQRQSLKEHSPRGSTASFRSIPKAPVAAVSGSNEDHQGQRATSGEAVNFDKVTTRDSQDSVDEDARRLASLVSRLPYASVDPYSPTLPEVASGTRARATKHAQPTHPQQGSLKRHAARVRNQFELRWQTFSYGQHLYKIGDGVLPPEQMSYNPLQIIRNRKHRENDDNDLRAVPSFSRGRNHDERQRIWVIPLSEQLQDMAWRKALAVKIRQQQLKPSDLGSSDSITDKAVSDVKSNDRDVKSESVHSDGSNPRSDVTSSNGQSSVTAHTNSVLMQSQFHAHQGRFMSSTTSISPTREPSSSELIARLRSRHSVDSSAESEGDNANFYEALEARPKFCRSVGSYSKQNDGASIHSTPSAQGSFGYPSQGVSSPIKGQLLGQVPALVVTSEDGKPVESHKSQNSTSSKPQWNSKWELSFGGAISPSSTRRTSMIEDPLDSDIGEVADEEEDPANHFGSLRPRPQEPTEKATALAENELEYMLALFRIALRKDDALSNTPMSPDEEGNCDTLRLKVKRDTVPAFIKYLGGVEKEVLQRQQQLDTDLAGTLDSLRVTTDRMVSEVNTTLNRQMRETNTRFERMCLCRDTKCLVRVGFTALEWLVLVLMWICWAVVKVVNIGRSATNALGWLFVS